MMNMVWILQCAVWIALTSAYDCDHNGQYYNPPPQPGYATQTWQPLPIRRNPATSERLTQRTNERSIAVTSDIQRVQDQERRRVQSKVEDPTVRTENSSYKIVNNYPKITASSLVNRRGQLEEQRPNIQDSVVFPGPTSESSQDFVPDIPEECLKVGYCENVPNYPTELATRIISQLGEKKYRFHVEVLDTTPEIVQRYGPPEENIEMCNSREKVVITQAAPDKKGKWYFILNDKNEPLQGLRVEVCKSPNSKCNEKVAYFYDVYKGTCQQKYVTRTMAAIDRAGNVVYDMPFEFPSCCSCIVSRKDPKS